MPLEWCSNVSCWLQADIQSLEIEVRLSPRSGHSEAYAGLPLLTRRRHSIDRWSGLCHHPNAPIALSDSPRCQQSHNAVFSDAVNPRRIPGRIRTHSIFPFKIKCCVDQLRAPPETDISMGRFTRKVYDCLKRQFCWGGAGLVLNCINRATISSTPTVARFLFQCWSDYL